jgi:hypothetical protein
MNTAITTQLKTGCAHSNGKPGVPTMKPNISVRFAPFSQVEIEIRNLTKHKPRKIMKTKILLPAMLSLAVMTLAGCGQHESDNSTPATTNSAAQEPMPGATDTNNATVPPAAAPSDTNSPAASSTNTNQ